MRQNYSAFLAAAAFAALLLSGGMMPVAAQPASQPGHWSLGPPSPIPRSEVSVAERGGGTFTENEAFDPRSGRWRELAPLPEGRHGTGAAVIGGKLYIPDGGPVNGDSQQSDTLYIFAE